jgi:hypothetical protein
MQYPLIERELLDSLRLVHGAYNSIVTLFILYQGWMGFRIRRDRSAKAPLPFSMIKRHRKAGPILAIMGGFGFMAGLTLVLLDSGNILEYPPHFFTGLAIIVLLIATFRLSGDIKGPDSPFRTPHFVLGIAILSLYLLDVLIGIGVLF